MSNMIGSKGLLHQFCVLVLLLGLLLLLKLEYSDGKQSTIQQKRLRSQQSTKDKSRQKTAKNITGRKIIGGIDKNSHLKLEDQTPIDTSKSSKSVERSKRTTSQKPRRDDRSERKETRPPDNSIDPLDVVGEFLLRYGKGATDLSDYSSREIHNALKSLARSQNALKTMDGATHKLRNTLSDSSSLSARYERFMNGKQRNMKEAAKVSEYVTTVERSLQASEILQILHVSDVDRRKSMLAAIGLEEVQRIAVTTNKMPVIAYVLFQVPSEENGAAQKDEIAITRIEQEIKANQSPTSRSTLRKLLSKPKRYLAGEVIIAVIDGNDDVNTNISQILRVMAQKLESVTVKAVGLLVQEVVIQPTLLSLAGLVLKEIKGHILPSALLDDIPSTQKLETRVGIDKNRAKLKSISKKQRNVMQKHTTTNSDSSSSQEPSIVVSPPRSTTTAVSGRPLPKHVRLIGYSGGGSVAAYCAMLLDGALNITSNVANITLSSIADPFHLHDCSDCIGTFPDRVRCVTLGSPPCVSRTLVPRYVTSIICGDDIVVRSYPESIASLRKRVKKALKMGAGKDGLGANLGWVLGAGWAKDFASIAGQSFGKYSARSKSQSRLSIPGRVFYMKSRQLKDGSTFQRVNRGNWREEMLWMLHDVMLSKRVIAHHHLEYYIQTLARC